MPGVSMNGEYLRLTVSELRRAIEDPDWALEFADGWRDALDYAEDAGDEWDGADPGEARHRYLTTHKAWDAIRYLLQRASFPIDVVFGEHAFTSEDTDWGYGPPRYLTAQEVVQAAAALATVSFDQLIDGLAPADLTAANVYPQMWDEPDALQWVRHWYQPLPQFFAAAAEGGDSMIIWLS
jgi:hypothetical protein